ncbi:MAG TPA: 3-deoxy-manno-octulosonate cytidylyltransferase [Bacteroidia bacterium]|nr:3-deoxy-manno-octulosonate cytidylyltransferase [Bacteroidia bacterium]
MEFIGIIPARYASTRFPGKPLVDINGKPMIQCVYEQAKKSKSLSKIIVATDDERIEKCVKNFGGDVQLTNANNRSGTDRCAEVAEKNNFSESAVIINIQGDEPFIHPEQIDLVASVFKNEKVQIATLVKRIKSINELQNPNTPKVILNKHNEAIYFSRAAIPFYRGKPMEEWLKNYFYYKHIGIYAYKKNCLSEISKLAESPLEMAESLEQLRWIENGYKINVAITDLESIAIDTPEDLQKIIF